MIPHCSIKPGVSPIVRIPVPLRALKIECALPFAEELTKIMWYWLTSFKFWTLETSKDLFLVFFPFKFSKGLSIGPAPRIPILKGELFPSNASAGQSMNLVKLWMNAALTSYSTARAWPASGAHQPQRSKPTIIKCRDSLFFKTHLLDLRMNHDQTIFSTSGRNQPAQPSIFCNVCSIHHACL